MIQKSIYPAQLINQIFYPTSVAVLGANRVKGSVPYDIFYNILRDHFQGVVYPVSPKETAIAGVRAYKYVLEIPDKVDLAVIVYQGSVVHMALEQCGQKGIKSAVIISAGFKETGPAGREKEEQLKVIAQKYGISFIGPNCLGLINTDPLVNLNASFARQMPEQGNIGFLSQSGALCTAVLDYAQAKHIGFSKFVSFGNKADISEIDLLYYLKDDPKTKVILLYLEEVSDGIALMKAAEEIISESKKPILILKAGRTKEGAGAAASHTGSLAGSDEICDAGFKQAGIIRCNDIEDMFNKAIALAYQPLPKGDRVAVITNAGGPGVLATDMVINQKLKLAQFSEETTAEYRKALPKTANIKNPVDVIGDARGDRYNIALTGALKDEGVDGACVILTPQSMTNIEEIAEEICKIHSQFEKPIYTSFMGESDVARGIDILQRNCIPHYQLPENMIRSFAATNSFREILEGKEFTPLSADGHNAEQAIAILNKEIENGKKVLPEYKAVSLLELFGLPVLPHGLAKDKEEAAAIAKEIGYPVVLKIMSENILHKYDVGGIVINLNDDEEVKNAFDRIIENVKHRMPEAVIDGIFVQKMVKNGDEVILGVKKDPSFGHVIMFGLGGIFVEVLKDVSFRIVPMSRSDIYEMIKEIKSFPLLKGVRGRADRDINSIAECIEKLSSLVSVCPQIKELDINPLLVMEDGAGCFIADTKIMI